MTLAQVVELVTLGLSTHEAVAYVLVEENGVDPEEWSDIRDVTPKAVVRNRDKAEEKLRDRRSVYQDVTGTDPGPFPSRGPDGQQTDLEDLEV